MSQIKSIFTQGYLSNKDLFSSQNARSGKNKRPEFWSYQPDQAFGANMVKGSENQNPWANRNQANAAFGNRGANTQIQNTSKVLNELEPFAQRSMAMPTQPTQREISPFDELISGGANIGSKYASDWLTKQALGTIQGPKKFSELSPEIQGYIESVASKEGTPEAYEVLAKQFGLESAGKQTTGGIYDRLVEQAVKDSNKILTETADAAATESIPWVGPTLRLGMDALTGDLYKRPFKSVGTAGGALGGAMLGSAIMPGIGTVLGGLLGGTGGGFLGRTLGRLF